MSAFLVNIVSARVPIFRGFWWPIFLGRKQLIHRSCSVTSSLCTSGLHFRIKPATSSMFVWNVSQVIGWGMNSGTHMRAAFALSDDWALPPGMPTSQGDLLCRPLKTRVIWTSSTSGWCWHFLNWDRHRGLLAEPDSDREGQISRRVINRSLRQVCMTTAPP